MNRFIITTTEIEKKEYRIAALCDARQKLIEVTTESMTGTSVLGNIYIGRVENVVKKSECCLCLHCTGTELLPAAAGAEKSCFYQKTIRKKSNLCRG